MKTSAAKVVGLIVKGIVIAAVVALLCIVVVSCANQGEREFKAKLYKADELVIPKNLDQEKLFGLFFYNPDGVTYTRSTESLDKINFDPNKPTAIFIHGMQMGTGYNGFDEIYNPIGWLDAGYNFGVFLWSQIADCKFPSIGKERIWYGNSAFFYEDEEGKRREETKDLLQYPTAMVFGAYYFDLMNRVEDYRGSSISIIGHSLGANTTIALGSYFTTLYEQGTITKEFLPDRFVYLDAYMDHITDNEHIVPWLNEPMGEGGVINMGIKVARKARALGISTEYLKSYKTVSYLSDTAVYGGTTGTSKTLFDELLYVDMQEISSKLFDNHVDSMRFYLRGMTATRDIVVDRSVDATNFPAYYDEGTETYDLSSAAFKEGIIGWGPTTPVSVTYARNYSIYEMANLNAGQQYSDNIVHPVVAGFAFEDYDGNGVYDERLQARVAGVTVALYEGSNKIAETVTTESGAYRFELGDNFAGKTYSIKATLPSGKTFTKKITSTSLVDAYDKAFMSNNVDAQGSSDTFSFVDKVQIKIVNVGVSSDEEE